MARSSPELTEYDLKFKNNRKNHLYGKYFELSDIRKDILGKPYEVPIRLRAIVFIAHGYGEHCLMYTDLARKLAAQKYFVMIHDHLGHGRSDGTRAQIDSFEKYVDDVFLHIELMKRRFSDLPIYIIGHSMGGAIAILAALRCPSYFSGLILIAPAVKTDPELTTPFKVHMAKNLRALFPHFPVATLDEALMCSCPDAVKAMKADPLRYQGYCKAAFGASLIEAMEKIQRSVDSVFLPFLMLQGDADKVCTPEGALYFFQNAHSVDKEIKIYPGAYHSLLFEPYGIAEQVKDDVLDWLNARVTPPELDRIPMEP